MKSKITKIQNLKKGIAIFLALLFMLTPMATIVYADTETGTEAGSESSSGSGTLLDWFNLLVYGRVGVETREFEEAYASEAVIHIKNEIQLRALAQLVNNGKDCSNKVIYLDNDIDMSGSTEPWVPIGYGDTDHHFKGTFKGENHIISGLNYSNEGKTHAYDIGLFGVIGEGGKVENLITKNFNINVLYEDKDIKPENKPETADIVSYYNIGSIAGSNYGTIENCKNTSNINGGSCVGGIVGVNGRTITSCTNTGNIKGYDYVGGIAGENEGTIEKSSNEGNIEGAEHAIGGIAGGINDDGFIGLSYNKGNVKSTNQEYDVGAIAGGNYSGNAEIVYCLNEGVINSLTQVDRNVVGVSEVYIIKEETETEVKDCVYLIETINGSYYIADIRGAENSYVAEFDIRIDDWNEETNLLKAVKVRKIQLDGDAVYNLKDEDVDGDQTMDQKIIFNPEFKIGYQDVTPEGGEEGSGEEGSGEETSRRDYRIAFEGTNVGAVVKIYKKVAGETEDTYVEITEDTYLKTGDVLKVETIYNRKLYTQLGSSNLLVNKENSPKLFVTIGEEENSQQIEVAPEAVNADGNTVTYTEEIKINTPNGKVTELHFKTDKVYYAVDGEIPTDTTKYDELKISFGTDGKSVAIDQEQIIIDTIAPLVNTRIYVEDNLKTERYTVGKQIWFEVTTTERIQTNIEDEEGNTIVVCKAPRIQVSFSESEVGKYNYQLDDKKEGIAKGYAKPESAIINEDGTTTWLYSYEVQEFDEGYVEFEYISGLITDIAGNQTDLEKLYETSSEVTGEEVTGTVLGEDSKLNVTYKFYKNEVKEENEVTKETYFTNEDDLIVVAEFDKVLYVHYGLSDGKNTNVRLDNAHKDRAPSLYLNADSVFVAKCEDVVTTNNVEATETSEAISGTTSLQYKFVDIAKEYNLNELTEITKVVFKNENNNEVVTINGTAAATNGLIPYAEKWFETYKSEQEEEYNTTFGPEKVIVVSGLDDIVIDPIGVTTKVEKSNIYAVTTAPTVTITANKPNPTNANLIEYTFTFSEYVKEFTVEDITVNNGEKVTEKVTVAGEEKEEVKFVEVEEGKKYTLEVKPTTTTGNKETLQVLVAGGACKDLVGIGNIAQESNITIDKVQPTFVSWNIKEDNKEIDGENKKVVIIEALFNEAISGAPELTLEIGGYEAKGTKETECIDNKAIYTYVINAADGGKVKATLSGKAKDVAGNDSYEINEVLESGFELSRTEIRPNVDEDITYTFAKNSVSITDFANPIYFVRGDKITVTKHWMGNKVDAEGKVELGEDGKPVLERKEATYEYKVANTINLTHMKYVKLTDATEEGKTIGEAEFSASSSTGSIDISKANIYFDTVKPSLTLSAEIEKQNENNIYKEGQKIIILAKTSEVIANKDEVPQLNVLFSVSGIGKYNYQGENPIKGNAQYIETIENEDGTITWKYEYIAQSGDEGEVSIGYAKEGKLVDLAGNETSLEADPEPTIGEVIVSDIEISGKETTLSYEFYKNDNKITDFGVNTYFKNGDTIKVIAKFSNPLYSEFGSRNTIMDKVTAPKLTIDGKEFKVDLVSGDGKEVTYSYNVNADANEKLDEIALTLAKELYARKEDNSYETISSLPGANIANCNLHIYNASTNLDGLDMKVDTTLPTVTISTNKTNPTKDGEVEYTFTWSEEVKGFGAEDIIVAETAIKGELVPRDNNVYTMTVNYDGVIPNGNQGEVTVAVVENAAEDLVNNKNAYVSNTLKIDRIAPIMISLEAYVKSSSEVQADTVKEYYKSGDVIEVVATFSESVETSTVPTLALQFSESGNANGTVSEGVVSGNKITYTYTIAEKDLGILSVKGFSGEVVDAAGNETKVTKKTLEGDTIIADTIAPQLVGITAIAPNFEYDSLVIDGETKRYGKDTTITIITEYSENVYNLTSNKIDVMTEAPELKLKFGSSTAKAATFDKVEGNKVYYTYTIVDGDNGDNGELSIESLAGNVSDIAGNTLEVNTNSPEFSKYEESITEDNKVEKIIADTTSATITYETSAINYDDNKNVITGNDNQYRKGAVITITATTNEYVYKNTDKSLERFETAPELSISFATSGTGKGTATNVEYKDNKTVFTYTYEIKDNDNGQLKLNINELVGYDIALNGNSKNEQNQNIYADTVNPLTNYQSWHEDEGYGMKDNLNGTWEVTFNEKIYEYDNIQHEVRNELSNSNKDKAPILLVSNGTEEFKTKVTNISIINNKTVITYALDGVEYKKNIGAKGFDFASISDKAGNLFNHKDQVAPVLENIKVTSPEAGTYKAGEVVTIVATFNEKLAGTAPTLALKFAESGDAKGTVSAGIIEENTITYTYTIVDEDNGDNGELQVKSFTSTELFDLSDNKWVVPETVTLSGNRIVADTTKPVINKVEVKDNNTVIGSYVRQPEAYNPGKTNANEIEYVITFSENINLANQDLVEVTNGVRSKVVCEGNKLTVTAKITTEGVQSLSILEGAVVDLAKVGGNTNEFFRFNGLTVDFTKPTVRFVSEYNGGVYVLPTSIGKVEIRTNVEINEDISKIEYKWDNADYDEITEYSSASDIVVPTEEFNTTGKHTLYIKVTDIAGNVTIASKEYNVVKSRINIDPSTTRPTNEDVIVTVEFEEGLTDNRRVAFKSEGSETYKGIVPNSDGTYTIEENGTIYAEATDKVGNKVFSEEPIENIDRVAPEVELTLNGADLVIGTGKEKATVKTTVNVSEPVVVEYYWSCNEETGGWVDAPLVSEENVTSLELNTASESGTCYLYVKVTDIAGNETELKSNAFKVLNTNEDKKVTEDENGEEVTEIIPAEIDIKELIDFKQEGKEVYITYNDSIIKEKDITLTNARDAEIDYETYSYVYANKETFITVVGTDACGNTVKNTYEVTRESIQGPEFEVYGNPENWTNQSVELNVSANEELSALTMNGQSILSEDKFGGKDVIAQNGEYKFIATDVYGLTSEKVIKVTKIDKDRPEISAVVSSGKEITITATDVVNGVEGSGVVEYAITDTSEYPNKWSDSNVIKVTHDGVWFAWVRDNAGNYRMREAATNIDTTGPVIRFDNTIASVVDGAPMVANIVTDEESKILYSWDNENWEGSEEFTTNVRVEKKYEMTGKYTLFVKAIDKSGNENKAQIEFTVTNSHEVVDPQIVFEGLYTTQIDGVCYVKVSTNMSIEEVTGKMKQAELCGLTPEYTKLTEDNKFKTGSEIVLNGDTKYVVVVNGDVNCDGKIEFLGDIILANNYRIGINSLNTIQKLAADIDNDGKVEFMSDILAMNNYRIGIVNSL